MDKLPAAIRTELFETFGDMVQDVVHAVQGVMTHSAEERRRQWDKYRIRKLRAHARRSVKQPRNVLLGRALSRDPELPGTELGKFVSLMRANPAPPVILSHADKERIPKVYLELFKEDRAMQALLKEPIPDENDASHLTMRHRLISIPSSVENKIHRIFRYENFAKKTSSASSISIAQLLGEKRAMQAWEAMAPALVLATKFLLTPETQGFWYHLMYGQPTVDETTGKTYLARSPLEDDKATAEKEFLAVLEALAERICFYWVPAECASLGKNLDGSFCQAFAIVQKYFEAEESSEIYDDWGLEVLPPFKFDGYISLSSAWLYHLLSPASSTRESLQSYMQLQINLAAVILHEFGGHAVYAFCAGARLEKFVYPTDIPDTGPLSLEVVQTLTEYKALIYPEPFAYLEDAVNEIGFSCEHALFGGIHVHHWSNPGLELFGPLVFMTWESSFNYPRLEVVGNNSWLQDLFREDTWRHIQQHLQEVEWFMSNPVHFATTRYLPEINKEDFIPVEYLNGVVVGRYAALNQTEQPVTGDVHEWYREVRERDVAAALASGLFVEEKFFEYIPGVRVPVSLIRRKPKEGEQGQGKKKGWWLWNIWSHVKGTRGGL